MSRFYVLYDGRACGGQPTDGASVFCTANSLSEALRDAKDHGQTAIYSYKDTNDTLTDERWECDTDAFGNRV